jgi:hypothetical protein
MASWFRAVVLIILGWTVTGCIGSAASTASRKATPVVIDTTLDEMERPEQRARMAAIMGTPEMQQTLRNMGSALTEGAVEGLGDEAMSAKLAPFIERISELIVSTLQRDLHGRLAPAAAAIATEVAQASVRAAADEIPNTLAPAMERALTEHIGPALEVVMRENITRGATAALSHPDVEKELGTAVRGLSHDVVLGSNDAMTELRARSEHQGGLLAHLSRMFRGIAWAIFLAVAAAVAIVTFLIVRLTRSHRELASIRRDLAANETLLIALVTAADSGETKEWLPDIREKVRARVRSLAAERPPQRRPRHFGRRKRAPAPDAEGATERR